MKIIEEALSKLAELQVSEPFTLFAAVLIVTVALSTGLTQIEMSSDFQKEIPQDLPALQADRKIESGMGGPDSLIVVGKISTEKTDRYSDLKDVRDPEVITALRELSRRLERDPEIDDVTSAADVFSGREVPETLEGSKYILSRVEVSDRFFNRDYSATILQVSGSVPSQEKEIKQFTSDIRREIQKTDTPPEMDFSVTGTPPIRAKILEFLRHDMVNTTFLAATMIFGFVVFLKRSVKKALQVFSPLAFALVWTFGTAGLLGIEITIATVFIGALLLGMGVEYGAFLVERYYEEIEGLPGCEEVNHALKDSVPYVGSSIVGSSSTTIAGFLALLIATIPMIRDLGLLLGIGITYSLVAVIFLDPLIIIGTESLHRKTMQKLESGVTA